METRRQSKPNTVAEEQSRTNDNSCTQESNYSQESCYTWEKRSNNRRLARKIAVLTRDKKSLLKIYFDSDQCLHIVSYYENL